MSQEQEEKKKKKKSDIPKWMRKYIQEVLILQEKSKGGKKGRPKFFDFKEGDITLYYLKYVKGYGREKIYRLLNKLAQKMKIVGEGEEYVSEKTIQRRLEEIEEKREELRKGWEELRAKHEEESTKEKIVYREEKLKELERYIDDVKSGKETLSIKKKDELVTELSDFEGIRFLANRWINSELGEKKKEKEASRKGNTISKKYFENTLRMAKKLYDFMVSQKRKVDPRTWTYEDIQDFTLLLKSQGYRSDTYRHVTAWVKLFPVTQDLILRLRGFQRGMKSIGTKKTSTHFLYVEEYKKAFDENAFCEDARKYAKKDRMTEEEEYDECQRFKTVIDLHLTTMAREGSESSSLFGIEWSDVNEIERTVRVFESKTQKFWEGIYLDLFPDFHLLENLKRYKKEGDRYIVRDTLGFTLEKYRKWLKRLGIWLGKVEERTIKGQTVKVTLSPHDIRRSGAYWRINYMNLPLESISGFKGGDRFYSPLGVGWEDPNTLVGYYASPTARLRALANVAKKFGESLLKDPEKVKQEALKTFSF